MRWIDADAFKEYIHNQNGRPVIGMTFGEMIEMFIDEQPTVEPPKGEWEECDWVEYDGHGECIRYSKEALRCSNCCNAFKKELLWKDNFCPHCGADMRGVTE